MRPPSPPAPARRQLLAWATLGPWLAAAPVRHAGAQPAAAAGPASPPAACPALLQHRFPRLQDEQPQDLCQYAGRVLLVVNTASYCGFTSQYQGLEALHAKYAARGLTVLGFPSNDFAQEPGSAKQIAELCFNTYGVKFPMFAKSPVRGTDANPFYQALAKAAGGAPKWNFHKYLVDRRGQVVASFGSTTTPQSAELQARIEKALT